MTTFLNLMVVLVPFLLITAVFSRITIVELSLPSSTSGAPPSPPSFRVEVIVREQGLEITNGESVIAAIPNVDDEYDMATLSEYLMPHTGHGRRQECRTASRGRGTGARAGRPVHRYIHWRRAMRNSRRMKRMSRNRVRITKMNLTSLMDVFTILVFFLLVNSATTEVLETPKRIALPESVIESKPRETVVIFVSPNEVMVQGEAVVLVDDILTMDGGDIEPIAERLDELSANVIGINTKVVAESQEVTILADKSVPFNVVKKVMSTCTGKGYGRISLAVMQKSPQTAQI
jgi:biopolymer transport protein ExbD